MAFNPQKKGRYTGIPLNKPRREFRRSTLFCVILAIHAVIIGGPLLLLQFGKKTADVAFKVKIGSDSPSHAPVIGPPERPRPTPEPGPAAAPPEPSAPPEPPAPPAPAEPEVAPALPKPNPKAIPKPKTKSQTVPKKTQNVKKTTPKKQNKTVKKTTQTKRNTKKTQTRPATPRRPRTVAEAQKGVFSGGPNNFNPNVPIGKRHAGQALGPVDGKTPMGGLSEKMEKYSQDAGRYLKSKWQQPTLAFIGNAEPAVLIELTIDAYGRVTAGRIVKPSGVNAVDESVKRMLDKLDRMPRPPETVTLQFLMQVEQ